jgi:hypothetical protein
MRFFSPRFLHEALLLVPHFHHGKLFSPEIHIRRDIRIRRFFSGVCDNAKQGLALSATLQNRFGAVSDIGE